MKSILKNNDGYSIMMTFLIIILLSVLGISLLTVSANSLKTSSNEQIYQSAYYAAEAGLNTEKVRLYNYIDEAYEFVVEDYKNSTPTAKINYDADTIFYNKLRELLGPVTSYKLEDFEDQFNNTVSANISLAELSVNPLTYEIKSQGTIGKSNRFLKQTYSIDLNISSDTTPSGSNRALHTFGDINISGGSRIDGNIASESGKLSKDIWSRLDGEFSNHIPLTASLPPFPTDMINSLETLSYPQNSKYKHYEVIKSGNLTLDNLIGINYELKLTDNMKFNTLKLNHLNTLTINTGNSDKHILVDNLILKNSGGIKIIGSGKLNLYVKNNIEIGDLSSINNTGSSESVSIFYSGTNKIALGGFGSRNKASFYCTQCDLEFSAGNAFTGTIATGGKSVKIKGGSAANSKLILAPNAKFELSGGSRVYGSVIAKSFDVSGGSRLTYTDGITNEFSDLYTDGIESGGSSKLINSSSIIEFRWLSGAFISEWVTSQNRITNKTELPNSEIAIKISST